MKQQLKTAINLLIEELESKKRFTPFEFTFCDVCGEELDETNEFCFMGSMKQKICGSCIEELLEFLNGFSDKL